jgi:hypothetical protein
MAILVVCNGCHARFQVSEQYAGKSGPCPKCKKVIQIPKLSETEVKFHDVASFGKGGRNAEGKLVLKPISRTEAKVTPLAVAGIVAGALLVLALAWIGGVYLRNNMILRAVALLAVAPPLIIAAYWFLRDDEREPYRGRGLVLRAGICALVYVGLWGVYGYVAPRVLTGDIWNWFFVAPPFLITGAIVALATLDLDFGSAFFHYGFFVLVSMLLRWAAGMDWLWLPPT